MKCPFSNSLLGWQELRHKDAPLTRTAPSLALGVGLVPQEAQRAGIKRQLLPWDLVSESQLSSGEDGVREMGFWGSRSDNSQSACTGQFGQGVPQLEGGQGRPRTTQAVK